MLADGNGEVGAQAQVAAGGIGEGEGAAADFFAVAVQENIGRLKALRANSRARRTV